METELILIFISSHDLLGLNVEDRRGRETPKIHNCSPASRLNLRLAQLNLQTSLPDKIMEKAPALAFISTIKPFILDAVAFIERRTEMRSNTAKPLACNAVEQPILFGLLDCMYRHTFTRLGHRDLPPFGINRTLGSSWLMPSGQRSLRLPTAQREP